MYFLLPLLSCHNIKLFISYLTLAPAYAKTKRLLYLLA